jgi:hypothetical protein
MARKEKDNLVVQVAIRLKAPKGAVIKKRVLQQILDNLADNKPIPKNVEIRGIFWRNPSRTGRLSMWRYHTGADLTVAPAPLESRPRGSLQDAIETLAGAIASGIVTF